LPIKKKAIKIRISKEKDTLHANSNFICKNVIPLMGSLEITPFHNPIIMNVNNKKRAAALKKNFKNMCLNIKINTTFLKVYHIYLKSQ